LCFLRGERQPIMTGDNPFCDQPLPLPRTAKIISAINNQNHSRNKPRSKNKKTPSSLQQCGPNNSPADKVHHHLLPAPPVPRHSIFPSTIFFLFLLPLLKVPNVSPRPSPPAPRAYITRPQASTPFQSVFVFACPLRPLRSLPLFSCSCACIG
jgi:hypothetical protein